MSALALMGYGWSSERRKRGDKSHRQLEGENDDVR